MKTPSLPVASCRSIRLLLGCFLAVFACPAGAADPPAVRGADELFWVPTLEQALDMGKATGRPLFLMGYSLVPNGSTYTKLGSDYCTGVF